MNYYSINFSMAADRVDYEEVISKFIQVLSNN